MTRAEASADRGIRPGDILDGRYQVIEELADGGMGTVFLAEHVRIKRRLAVKVLHRELATDIGMVRRFMNEALAAGTLGHPNIVESTDMGFTPANIPYIVYEYLEGVLLTDAIYRCGGMSVRRALRIAKQIASALEAAHAAGIIHLDLKSENVFLVARDGSVDHVKVLDFGISRFMAADAERSTRGIVIGTPEFMAPEQVTMPELVDARADIYALGVVLYEMLAARRPFGADDSRLLLHRVVHEPPPPLDRHIPNELERLLFDRLLCKSPAQRIPTMEAVQSAFDAIQEASRSAELPAPVVEPPPQGGRGGAVVMALVALAVIAGAALQLAEPHAAAAVDDADVAALAAAAAEIAAALQLEARTARQRADAVATTPMLRVAIETDAPTIQDLVENERLFAPSPGEVVEIFQLRERRWRSMVRIPRDAAELAAGATASVRLAHGTLIASAPISAQRTRQLGGAVAVALPVELPAIAARFSPEVLAVFLVGLDAPVALAGSGVPAVGVPVAAPIELHGDFETPELRLAASIRPVRDARTYRLASHASFGIAGALTIGFAIYLVVRLARRYERHG